MRRTGYRELGYERVAAEAGVSRPALYRRAANKAMLVVNALVDRYGLEPVPDTGSVRDDLLALQDAQLCLYRDPVFLAALPGLLDDLRENEEARVAWVEGFVAPRRVGVERSVARAVQRGELDPACDADWVCEVLTGPLVSSALLRGPRPLPDKVVEETVALVLLRFGAAPAHPGGAQPQPSTRTPAAAAAPRITTSR